MYLWGAWVAQSVECLTLDLGSGHDLTSMRSSPALGSVLTAQSLLEILSLTPSLSLKINKYTFLKKKEDWGAWVAQLVKRPTSAQVVISRSLSSSPRRAPC